jgi:hypothetical protein
MLAFIAFMGLWIKVVDNLIMLIIFAAFIISSLPWSWLFVEFVYGPPKTIIPMMAIGAGFGFNLTMVISFLWYIRNRKAKQIVM